jgi:membrane-associated phospholipid phosphatase
MFDWIIQQDRALFQLINKAFISDFLDSIMPFMRNSKTWYPLYLFLVGFVYVNHGPKSLWWILFFLLTPAIGDLISSSLIKETIFRLRPCNNPAMDARFLLHYRPQSSSFTSSHATNHFAIATFVFFSLSVYSRKWLAWLFAWAILIAYAQVYVGVHYPLDVVGGAFLGFLIGFSLYHIYKRLSTLD